MARNESLRRLRERLKRLPPLQPRRIPDKGRNLQTGQIWSVVGRPCRFRGWLAAKNYRGESLPTSLVVLLEKAEENLFRAVALFRWGELAGPHDFYLPRELAGADLIVSLEKEFLVGRKILDECHGRFTKAVIEYVFAARQARDDPHARQRFLWGPAYLSSNDHRGKYHESLAEHLHRLQTLLCMTASVPKAVAAKKTYFLWQNFANLFENFPVLAAADSAEHFSECVILRTSAPKKCGFLLHKQIHARCVAFDPLVPSSNAKICCEWLIPTKISMSAPQAFLYDGFSQQPIGHARIKQTKNGVLVILTNHRLAPNARPVEKPEKLKIVIIDSGAM